mmetsp:Transcript_68296/g.216074  ORF Transcript_68296/g.216074 Transcript_68296/m.216074 type:complete len:286 (-) Transcript_68296:1204-2061(-)
MAHLDGWFPRLLLGPGLHLAHLLLECMPLLQVLPLLPQAAKGGQGGQVRGIGRDGCPHLRYGCERHGCSGGPGGHRGWHEQRVLHVGKDDVSHAGWQDIAELHRRSPHVGPACDYPRRPSGQLCLHQPGPAYHARHGGARGVPVCCGAIAAAPRGHTQASRQPAAADDASHPAAYPGGGGRQDGCEFRPGSGHEQRSRYGGRSAELRQPGDAQERRGRRSDSPTRGSQLCARRHVVFHQGRLQEHQGQGCRGLQRRHHRHRLRDLLAGGVRPLLGTLLRVQRPRR